MVLNAICLLGPAAQGRTPERVEGRAPVSAQERIVPEPGPGRTAVRPYMRIPTYVENTFVAGLLTVDGGCANFDQRL